MIGMDGDKEKYPLVYEALAAIALDNNCNLVESYVFPDDATDALRRTQELLSVLKGKDIKYYLPPFYYDEFIALYCCDELNAFDVFVGGYDIAPDFIVLAHPGSGNVASTFLNACFDGCYVDVMRGMRTKTSDSIDDE